MGEGWQAPDPDQVSEHPDPDQVSEHPDPDQVSEHPDPDQVSEHPDQVSEHPDLGWAPADEGCVAGRLRMRRDRVRPRL